MTMTCPGPTETAARGLRPVRVVRRTDYIDSSVSIGLGRHLYRTRPPSDRSMERKQQVNDWDDFDTEKLVRGAIEETHQAEFALK